MKKKSFAKFARLLLFCVILGLTSCEPENKSINGQATNQESKIIEAKNWFEDYKSKVAFDPMFEDVNYHWEVASKITLDDGSEAIRLPITDINQNPEYKGEKMLYLYPTKKGYDVVLHELIPDQKRISKEDVFANLDSYSGYIGTWDLKNGFIKGAKFIDSKFVQSIKIKLVSKNRPNSITRREDAIELDEVLVSGSGTESLSISRDFSIGGSVSPSGGSTGSYFNAPHGATDASNPEVTANPNPCDKLKKLIDDPNYKNALAYLKTKLTQKQETGFYISASRGYEAATPIGMLQVTGTRYSDTYGIMHVHQDPFTYLLEDGVTQSGVVEPIKMFSPGDVKAFCSLLLTANQYKKPLDAIFVQMVSSTGNYQLRFEGDIKNVKNFDYESLDRAYLSHMDLYSNDLETGLLTFIKDYIGISGITLFKIKDDGSSESNALSGQNIKTTNPC